MDASNKYSDNFQNLQHKVLHANTVTGIGVYLSQPKILDIIQREQLICECRHEQRIATNYV